MLEISRSRTVSADPATVWADVAEPARLAEWYAFCDEIEVVAPDRWVLVGSWGAQRSAVTVGIIDRSPPERLAWRHLEETLDDRPAPALSGETTGEVLLEAVGEGTEVTITSRQVAASRLRGLAMRLLGRRQIANMLDQSLTLLAARHTAQ